MLACVQDQRLFKLDSGLQSTIHVCWQAFVAEGHERSSVCRAARARERWIRLRERSVYCVSTTGANRQDTRRVANTQHQRLGPRLLDHSIRLWALTEVRKLQQRATPSRERLHSMPLGVIVCYQAACSPKMPHILYSLLACHTKRLLHVKKSRAPRLSASKPSAACNYHQQHWVS